MTTGASIPYTSAGSGGLELRGKGKSKVPWRPEEDAALRALVAAQGTVISWSLISQSIPGRSNKACRLRWCNQLAPGLKHQRFTLKEDETLMQAQRSLGNKWAAIARLFPGHSENGVKNRWHCSLKRKHCNSD